MSNTYAIADLHGRNDLLIMALKAISYHLKWNPGDEEMPPHKIVFLGDYVDRGPSSAFIIDHLIKGQRHGLPWICLKGNHEDMMVETLTKPLYPNWWLSNGGNTTLLSYGHENRGVYDPTCVPDEHVAWLRDLPLFHADEHRIYVHAGTRRGEPLASQDPQILMWKLYDDRDEAGHDDGRHVVHGHHQFENGPLLYQGRTDLDTFAWYTGRLVVGVFDDEKAGGPVDLLEIKGDPIKRVLDVEYGG